MQQGHLATIMANSLVCVPLLILPYRAFPGTSSIPASHITAPISNPRA